MNNLSPDDLTDKSKKKYELNAQYFAEGKKGMVVATSGAPAIRAGVDILKNGGNAIDAALTTTLAEVTLSAGSWSSFALL